ARGNKRGKRTDKGRRGRIRTADKVARAERTEEVYPDGVERSDCWLSHTRPIWRLEQGRAVLVAYRVYRGPNDQYGKIPGVLGRSEFALEIVVAIAFQVYVVGLSFDKVCLVLHFFQNLKLSKSQADSLLHQLARHWHKEFDVLCTLLANSLVVHTDETSWSLNSVWAFLSEKAGLLEIYRAACRVQRDGRLGDAGRARKVAALEDEILELCSPLWFAELPPLQGLENDYRLLVNEIMRLLLAEELFTFVTARPVEQPNGEMQTVGGTNNEADRTLRKPAAARKTGRTNKTVPGARRQTILTSVLESLRLYLSSFTLSGVIAEVRGWLATGRSCFEELREQLGLARPTQS